MVQGRKGVGIIVRRGPDSSVEERTAPSVDTDKVRLRACTAGLLLYFFGGQFGLPACFAGNFGIAGRALMVQGRGIAASVSTEKGLTEQGKAAGAYRWAPVVSLRLSSWASSLLRWERWDHWRPVRGRALLRLGRLMMLIMMDSVGLGCEAVSLAPLGTIGSLDGPALMAQSRKGLPLLSRRTRLGCERVLLDAGLLLYFFGCQVGLPACFAVNFGITGRALMVQWRKGVGIIVRRGSSLRWERWDR